jgi:hypothetical protein
LCEGLSLASKASSIDPCSIDLAPPTSTPDKLPLVVELVSIPGPAWSVAHDRDGSGGWSISRDGSHVDLIGDVCDADKAGKFSRIMFAYSTCDYPPLALGPIP